MYACVLMCFQTRHFYYLKLIETNTFVLHFIKFMDVIDPGSLPVSPVEYWYQHIVILSCYLVYPRLADCNTHIVYIALALDVFKIDFSMQTHKTKETKIFFLIFRVITI